MTAPGFPLTPETGLTWLRQMLLIRRFEEQSAQEYSAGRIRGFLHLYIGQEACAVGVIGQLQSDDPIFSHYREHGHALVRGLSARSVMAEMFGKLEGCSKGRGGSMHLFDASRNFVGGNAIVAGGMPMAAGMALSDKMLGRPRVTACFIGDGSVAEGVFHETLNLSALWKLPVLFVCENNRYAMGTALSRHQSETDLAKKASSYRLRAEAVDGMDVLAVAEAASRAVSCVRGGEGPFFLELRTYRFRPHSMFDAELYRDKSEVEEWKKKDPISLFEARLRERGILDDEKASALGAAVESEVMDSVAFASAGTFEPVSALLDDVSAPRPGGAP
jgi:pyruvate dehydrogenase E1 component alpha subunit